MKYDVVAVVDMGTNLKAKYVDTYQNSLLKNDDVYVKVSNVAADVIMNAISEHKDVFIPKGIHGEISFVDLIISDANELERNKKVALSNMYQKMNHNLFHISALDFFDFINAFSSLADKGYYITDRNREERYLEIIETGNEDLICDLERYLESKDKIYRTSQMYKMTREIEGKMSECDTQEKLDLILEEYKDAL